MNMPHHDLDIAQVKAHADIIEIIGRVVELHQRGQNWWGHCPFHQDNNPSFSVNPEKGVYHCFGCGAKGDVITFLQAMHHIDFRQAIALLTHNQTLPVDSSVNTALAASTHKSTTHPHEWHTYLAGMQPYPGSPAEVYLCRRGLTNTPLVQQCGVKYHPNWYSQGAAVLFPIRNRHGQLVAAEGRFLHTSSSNKLKYRSAGVKRQGVFATPDAFHRNNLIIVESAINALTLAICGSPAIAVNGAHIVPDWLPDRCQGKRVFIGFDRDSGGTKGAQVLHNWLASHGITAQELPLTLPAADWNDALQRYGVATLTTTLTDLLSHPTP